MAPSTKPSIDGNPSSKSGVNYSDIPDVAGNSAGSSTDNVYYIDGINISDNYYGDFGANFNSEIIQEQQIITGGVPAEYEGGMGLISRVVSKSGGNEFHGSVNYYMQSDSLVADNDNLADSKFSTFDTAFTFGGPIVQDKLWFFTSLQRKEREEDVIDPNTQSLLRTVTRTDDYGFLKLTYQPTENDKIVAQWFNDPGDRDGSFDTGTLANRDRELEFGGDNLKLEYSHAWENVIATVSYIDHTSDDNRIVKDQSSENNVAYLSDQTVTNAELELGGFGVDTIWDRGKESLNLTLEWFVETGLGSHEFKFGYSDQTNEHNLNQVYTGDGSRYTSIASADGGADLDSYTSDSWLGDVDITGDDYNRIITAMAGSSNAATYVGLYDTDSSGDISPAELGAGLVFDSTAGNPNGQVNVYRIDQVQVGPTNFKTDGDVFFAQDSWSIDEHWTVNAGVRAERWSHYDSAGGKIFTFDWEYAPRLSVVYDIKGDGASKVWGFFGKYYDPIRTNMTDFAGTVTGSILEEQVYTGANEWLTYRVRGGPSVADAFFAPTTKTPYTDEFMIGWEHSLTPNQSISVTYTDRQTNDILEDYDLGLYTDCTSDGSGDYCLPLSYFGFSELPEANYFIATLAGAKRDYKGWEVSWRKRRSADSQWFLLASIVNNDAKGNSNSDSNADFQGDVVWLDPRSPGQYGKQPGNIEWLVKTAGSYAFDNGLEVGATYRWNSGTRYSRTWLALGRHLPERVETAYEDGGVTTRWLADDAVGGYEGSSYGQLDARVKYTMEVGNGMEAEFFLDVFNLLDDQAARRFMDLDAGDGVYDFQEARDWVDPRRFYLGARLSF
jgi:outer membrane receptor protein involved in Fe transport